MSPHAHEPEETELVRPAPSEAASSDHPGQWLRLDGVEHRCVVLVVLTRTREGERQVLLGLKRTGFGRGKIMALGGKIEARESAVEAAVREVSEESGIVLPAASLRDAGRIWWTFPGTPASNMTASLFTAPAGTAEAVETEEISPHWSGVDAIPWDRMWQDAPHWLPALLTGARVDARIVMAPDGQAVASAAVGPSGPL